MPLDVANLAAVLRRRAMMRLVAGVRAGSDHVCTVLKATVSAPTAESDDRGPAEPGVFEWHPEKYRGDVPQWAAGSPIRHHRRRNGVLHAKIGDPPYMRSGEGRNSIGFQITRVDYVEGVVVVRFGVDGTARDPQHPYMLFHERGIRYPTLGPSKGTGPLIVRPWLRPTLRKYWDEFGAIVIMVGRGLA